MAITKPRKTDGITTRISRSSSTAAIFLAVRAAIEDAGLGQRIAGAG
jgi:hypothetical protein